MYLIVTLSTIYVVIAFVFLVLGVIMTCVFAEFGAECEEYQAGRLMMRLWLIWPVCLVWFVKQKIEEAEGEEDEGRSDRS